MTTKAELVTAIAEKAGINKNQAKDALEAFIDAVTDSLKSGSDVRLVGFGTFKAVTRAAGTARERVELVLHVLPVNRAHLAMRLGRPVTWRDVAREQTSRVGAGLTWIRRKAVRRGR